MGRYYNRYFIYSSVIDYSYYKQFQQNNLLPYFSVPGVGLSMTAVLGYNAQVGTVAQFFDNDRNDELIKQLTDDTTATYKANVFAVTVFDKKWDLQNHVKPNRTGDLMMYLQPLMIEGVVGSSAKRALPTPVKKQNISSYLLRNPEFKSPAAKPRL